MPYFAEVRGIHDWSYSRDDDGYRTYNVDWLVQTNWSGLGPTWVANAIGLPAIGTYWQYGSDVDPWCFCTPYLEIVPWGTKNEPHVYWIASQKFTNRPLRRCQDEQIDDPLLEPPKLSGSWVKRVEEAQFDRHGDPIRNTAKQLVRGKLVERDFSYPTITWTLNSATLPIDNMSQLIDVLNDAELYGLGPRKIKLSEIRYERLLYGVCSFFYPITYTLEVNEKGFDRTRVETGTAELIVNPDTLEEDYVVHKDRRGEPMEIFLDENGRKLDLADDPVETTDELYDEGDLLLLGIPSVLA